MTQKQKTIIIVAVGLTIMLPLPLAAIGIFVYLRKPPAVVPGPKQVEAVAPGDWVEVVPESYWVIGPFGPGHEKAYEPEQQPDPARPCKTPAGKELEWVVKPIIPGALCLDFRRAFRQKKTDDTAAYALVYVHSANNQPGELLLGSDDTITVWLNDVQVHQNLRLRPGIPDDDRAAVEWKQGRNTLLIKVGNATGDHLFFAKLRSPAALRWSTAKELE
jgi:hypothetical protein